MSLEIVKRLEGEILGPESGFAVARSERRAEWAPIIAAAAVAVVSDSESKQLAVGYGKLLQASEKELAKLYSETKQSIDAIKKPILEAEKLDLGAIKVAKDRLGVIVQAYNKEQGRIHQEAARKAQEEARREAEERRLAEAIAAEQAGEKEEAEQILNEKPMMMAPAIVQKANVKLSGEVEKQTFSAVVTDLAALVRAVADGKVPLQAIKADEPWINTQARSFRLGLNYPGVAVKETTSTHFRS